MGQTVNLLVYTFGGSNPSSPTKESLRGSFLLDIRLKAEVAQLVEH